MRQCTIKTFRIGESDRTQAVLVKVERGIGQLQI